MNILVTGGAGFIGSHLCERLVERGNRVVAIDNLSTGRRENIAHLIDSSSFEFVQSDVCDAAVMAELIKHADVVYHLAAAVGVKLIVDRPVHTIETNIRGTEVVLEYAARFNKKLFIASTSEVYGKSEKVPFREDDDTVLGSTRFPRWSYACSKAIDEFLAFAYHKQHRLQVVIGRLFNTIGPRQIGSYGMVVPRFVEKALNGQPIEIYGSGQQTRCFAYVGDVIDGIIGLLEDGNCFGNVFNIGSDQEVTIEALADMIIEKTGNLSEKKFIPYEKVYGKQFDDMQRRVPCLDKINAAIGYKPKHSLSETLDIIIDSFSNQKA